MIYSGVGFIASMIGSMVGLGGGSLAIPILYYFGLETRYIVGNVKFMILITSIVSTSRYASKIKLPLNLYLAVASPMVVTAYIGAYLAAVLPKRELTIIVSLIIMISGANMIYSARRGKTIEEQTLKGNRLLYGIFSGALAGLVSGVSGLAGGLVNMPTFLIILKLDPHTAVALSMACIVPSALTSVVRHFIDSLIYLEIALPLGLGAVLGGAIGPKITLRVEKEKLRKIISLAIVLSAVYMLINTLLQ